MEQKVYDFIESAKASERELFEQRRDAHLIKLGLVSDETTILYSNTMVRPFVHWDYEKQKYYCISQKPLVVTDEEYAEICRVSPPEESDVKKARPSLFVSVAINVGYVSIAVFVVAFLILIFNGQFLTALGVFVSMSIIVLMEAILNVLLSKTSAIEHLLVRNNKG